MLAEKIPFTGTGASPSLELLMELAEKDPRELMRKLSCIPVREKLRMHRELMQLLEQEEKEEEDDRAELTLPTGVRSWSLVASELHKREKDRWAQGEWEPGEPVPGRSPLCGQAVRNCHDVAVSKIRDQLSGWSEGEHGEEE